MATIFLVNGDNKPQVQVNLTRADTQAVVNCVGATCTLKIRARGATATLFTVTASNNGTNLQNGILLFTLGANLTNIDAGAYEGEVNVVFNGGDIETVYELVDFVVREEFA